MGYGDGRPAPLSLVVDTASAPRAHAPADAHVSGNVHVSGNAHAPALVIVDLDDAAAGGVVVGELEAACLARLTAAGVTLVIASGYLPHEVERSVRTVPALAGAPVLGQDPSSVATTPTRPDALETLCRERACPPARTLLIAATPHDIDLAFAAGTVVALKGAGELVEALSDTTMPPRERGGMVQALRWARRWYGETVG